MIGFGRARRAEVRIKPARLAAATAIALEKTGNFK
jgi:hypothetical protein